MLDTLSEPGPAPRTWSTGILQKSKKAGAAPRRIRLDQQIDVAVLATTMMEFEAGAASGARTHDL